MVDYRILLGPLAPHVQGELLLWAGSVDYLLAAPTGRISVRSYAAVTEKRLVLSPRAEPWKIMDMSFSEVVAIEKSGDGRTYAITSHPRDYPAELLQYNPEGALDYVIYVLDLAMIPVLDRCLEGAPNGPLSAPGRNQKVSSDDITAANSTFEPVELEVPDPTDVDSRQIVPMSRVSAGVAEAFLTVIAPFLDEEEYVVSAGESVWVQYGLQHGRGSGEGILAVTNRSVIFVLNRTGMRVKIPLFDVQKTWKTFIVIPNFSEIHFKAATGDDFSFYATKRMCKEILSLRVG